MVTYAELVEKHAIKKNETISTFLSGMSKQIDAFKKGESNRRSWVKEDVTGYLVKLGKLEDEFHFNEKNEVLAFFDQIKQALKDDADFCAKLENVYGTGGVSGETKVRRPRKPKST